MSWWGWWCLVTQSCPDLCDPMYCSPTVSLFMGLPRQECWRGLPFPSPGHLPNQGLNLHLLHWQVGSLSLSHLGMKYWEVNKVNWFDG